MLGIIFFVLWCVNVLLYLKLKSAIRDESAADFEEIFGVNKPFNKSLNFIGVAFNKNRWDGFKNIETIKWLRLHWISSIVFIGYGVAVVLFHIISSI